jgi:PA14 domain/Viral BACON domain
MLNSLKQWFKILALLVALVACGLQEPAPTTEEAVDTDTKATATNGLTGVYYDNLDFTGITKTRVDATINKTFGTAAPITGIAATTYSVRWTGQIMPAFGQTYTFYLTSSDGARLMVNGQVLVNDWKDGTSRVRSGTVALVANTKYDIRLEYYRNATNAGAVKLEWQSASRARQVVPTGNLFPTGSNLEAALAKVKAVSGFPVGVNFDPLQATGSKTTNGFVLIAREQGKVDFMVATLRNDVVELLYRSVIQNNELLLTSVLENKTFNLGLVSLYVNADGSFSQDQKDNLSKKLISIVSQGNITTSDSVIPQSIKSQPRIVAWICKAVIPRPASCVNCEVYKNNYSEAVCDVVGGITALIGGGLTALVLSPLGPGGVAAGVGVGLVLGGFDIPTIGSIILSPGNLSSLWQAYLNCIAGKIGTIPGCPPILEGPTPNLVTISAPVNTSGFFTVDFNSSLNSQSVLVYFYYFNRDSLNLEDVNSGGGLGNLAPGQHRTLRFYYNCPSLPAKLTGSIGVQHNASNISSPVTVPVLVDCYRGPQISVTPPSLSFLAPLNSSAPSKSLTIQNDGYAPLTGSISTQQSWLSVTPSSFSVNPKINSTDPSLSNTVQVTASCGAIVETRTGTLEITHNATNASSPLQVLVTVVCGEYFNVEPKNTTITFKQSQFFTAKVADTGAPATSIRWATEYLDLPSIFQDPYVSLLSINPISQTTQTGQFIAGPGALPGRMGKYKMTAADPSDPSHFGTAIVNVTHSSFGSYGIARYEVMGGVHTSTTASETTNLCYGYDDYQLSVIQDYAISIGASWGLVPMGSLYRASWSIIVAKNDTTGACDVEANAKRLALLNNLKTVAYNEWKARVLPDVRTGTVVNRVDGCDTFSGTFVPFNQWNAKGCYVIDLLPPQ